MCASRGSGKGAAALIFALEGSSAMLEKITTTSRSSRISSSSILRVVEAGDEDEQAACTNTTGGEACPLWWVHLEGTGTWQEQGSTRYPARQHSVRCSGNPHSRGAQHVRQRLTDPEADERRLAFSPPQHQARNEHSQACTGQSREGCEVTVDKHAHFFVTCCSCRELAGLSKVGQAARACCCRQPASTHLQAADPLPGRLSGRGSALAC